MPLFDVYIEFYGKKFKTLVEADNEFRAEQKVKARLKFLKIVPADKKDEPSSTLTDNDVFNFLKGFSK